MRKKKTKITEKELLEIYRNNNKIKQKRTLRNT